MLYDDTNEDLLARRWWSGGFNCDSVFFGSWHRRLAGCGRFLGKGFTINDLFAMIP
jgi:hypothetical protein